MERSGYIHHDIYITLRDKSASAVFRQLALGNMYLSNHPGEVAFSGTILDKDVTRHKQVSYLVNEESFDVAFHMVFKNKESHDKYQVSDRHVNHFIPKSKVNWSKIQVFDTVVVRYGT